MATEPKEVTALERSEPPSTELTQRMTVNQVEEAFREYQDLQRRLDALMPEQILVIGKGKNEQRFRKKGYWRAVKKWARLDVRVLKEERIQIDDDWGYLVTMRATSPDGTSEDGDGSCMSSEKRVYKKDWDGWERGGKRGPPKPMKDRDGKPVIDEYETSKNATVHNVRAHAMTRAKNRAISDLVGFGEVSAEELSGQRRTEPEPSRQFRQQEAQRRADTEAKQVGPVEDLFHQAKAAGMSKAEWDGYRSEFGITKDGKTHTKERVEQLRIAVEKWIVDYEAARDARCLPEDEQPLPTDPVGE